LCAPFLNLESHYKCVCVDLGRNGNTSHHLGTDISVHNGLISTVTRADAVGSILSFQMYVPQRSYVELEPAVSRSRKYRMEILFENLNQKFLVGITGFLDFVHRLVF
jgi:hypothetical protein